MSLWRTLAHALGRRAAVWALVGLLASIGFAIVELAVSWFIQAFLNVMGVMSPKVVVAMGPDFSRFSPHMLGAALLVVAALRGIFQWVFWQSSFVTQEVVVARLRRLAVYDVLLARPRRYVAASALQGAIGEGFIKTSSAVFALVLAIGGAVQALVLWLFMFHVAWRPALLTTVGLVLVAAVVTFMNRKVQRVAEQIPVEVDGLNAGLLRVLRNALLVRVLRTEHREHKHLTTFIERHLGHSVRATELANAVAVLPPFMGVVLILAVLAFVGGSTSPSALLSFLYLFTRFVQAAAVAAQQSGQLVQHAGHAKRSLSFVASFSPSEIDDAMREIPIVKRPGTLLSIQHQPPGFQLRDVSFAYEGSERDVLSRLSLSIAAGQCFAVVGPSGVGKSTLLGLLLGVLSPGSGEVMVGGMPAEQYFETQKPRTGYVGADAFLVAGTLRDNLCYGIDAQDFSEAQLWSALRAARLEDQVRALPLGLQHLLNEDGGGLSAGQKQRLCLARALLLEPELLVLDEASANLDEATESEIAESLLALRGRCTIVIVSHRPGILKHADVRLDLSNRLNAQPGLTLASAGMVTQ